METSTDSISYSRLYKLTTINLFSQLTIRNPYWMTFSVYSFKVKSPSGLFKRSLSKKLDKSFLFASKISFASSVPTMLILLQQSQGQALIRQHQLGRLRKSFLKSLQQKCYTFINCLLYNSIP